MTFSPEVAAYFRRFGQVPGWLAREDFRLLHWFLEDQRRRAVTGDVLEIGAYLGKTAMLLQLSLGPGERLVACDLFEAPAAEQRNRREKSQYRRLRLDVFRAEFAKHGIPLPEIHQCSSLELPDRLPPGGFRLVHVDGSHLYDFVRADLATTRRLLGPDGVVVCDDYRTLHAPGVAAAVWESVLAGSLRVICVSEAKLYGTWTADDGPTRDRLRAWIRHDPYLTSSEIEVAGAPFLQVNGLSRTERARRAWMRTTRVTTRQFVRNRLAPPRAPLG